MRIITVLDDRAQIMTPGIGGIYAGSTRIASPTGTGALTVMNITRPGKLPIVDDTIALRDLTTNRIAAVTVSPGQPTDTRFWLTSQVTDYQAERFEALVRVRGVATRADGMQKWELGPYFFGGDTSRVAVTVLDHSVGARIEAPTGVAVRTDSGAVVARPGRGATVSFHPFAPSDVLDLRSDQEVWLSINGEVVSLDAELRLRVDALREGPLTNASWAGQLFRIESVDRHGVLAPGDRFRLRAPDIAGPHAGVLGGRTNGTVVVRDGRLVVRDDVTGDDASAVFIYAQLDDLDLYWNPTTQDNACFIGAGPAGYTRVRTEGRVLVRPRAGTVPLKSFFSTARGDTMTTATVEGEEAAIAAGYAYRGVVGWAYAQSRPETRPARQYWHRGRGDNMLTATRAGEHSCGDYAFLYDDCHVIRVDEPAPLPAPSPAPGGGSTLPQLDPAVAGAIRGGNLGRRGGLPLGVNVNDFRPELIAPLRRPVRALVLSGGGAKGAFEAGVIQALWRDGYRPDIVCGVSVGAINAAKISERRSDSADELVSLWRTFSSDDHAVFLDSFYTDLLRRAADDVTGTLADAGIWGLFAQVVMNIGAPGSFVLEDGAAVATALVASETAGLNDQIRRLLNLAFMTHALHSMQPLRERLLTHIQPARIAEAGTRMRLGITDAKTGCYLSVTEPFASGALGSYGLVELEPDMAEGGNWLTEPIFGADYYAMRLVDAVYASSTMPLFMEPLVARLHQRDLVAHELGRIAKLTLALPDGVQDLIDAGAPHGVLRPGREPIDWEAVRPVIDAYAADHGLPADDRARAAALRRIARLAVDDQRGSHSSERIFFDGGLVDAIPLRTAIRMGATEILVVGVDQLDAGGVHIKSPHPITQYSWMHDLLGGDAFAGLDAGSLPVLQYGLAALGGFVFNTTRGDMLSALGVLDTRHLGALAIENMTPAERTRFTTAIEERHRTEDPRRRALLGGTTSLGGFEHDDYGSSTGGNVTIDVILPDRPLLDSLGFADRPGVDEALELGRMAARNPVRL